MFDAARVTALSLSRLDELLLDTSGRPRVVPASRLGDVPPFELFAWCAKRGVFQIVTEELVQWLHDAIAGRRAIEIASGNGALGQALGIPCTDSRFHDRAAVRLQLQVLGHAPIRYGRHVERLDAAAAIRKYDPEVVVGAWVVQQAEDGLGLGHSMGVREWDVVGQRTYLHVGNKVVHAAKRINAAPHSEYFFPWLFSKALQPEANQICVWEVPRDA